MAGRYNWQMLADPSYPTVMVNKSRGGKLKVGRMGWGGSPFRLVPAKSTMQVRIDPFQHQRLILR